MPPKIMYGFYVAVFGHAVKWLTLKEELTISKLGTVQRTALLRISGALRTTSTEAMNVIMRLENAACTAVKQQIVA